MSGPTPDRDPVVLIHGAWQGAWVWDRLLPFLNAARLETVALDMPGNGAGDAAVQPASLDDYVAHVRGALERFGRPSSLIAHSGGGVIASAVAEAAPDLVSRIVYVAGIMLPDGVGFADVIASVLPEDPSAVGIGAHLEWSDDRLFSRVPREAALEYFFHDGDPADALAAAARLKPQSERGRAVKPRLTEDRFGRIPRVYVEATADRSVVPACQRRMRQLVPGARVVTMPTGHAPHFVAPGLLADKLLPYLVAPAAPRSLV